MAGSVGKDNPTQVPLNSPSPCPNKANSTAGNSDYIVKSDLLFGGNNIVRIATNGQQVSLLPTQVPISSHPPCGALKPRPEDVGGRVS